MSAIKSAFAQFATGVAVVTARCESDLIGMTITSFNTVSIDPPLVLFSVGHERKCLPKLRAAGGFAINILSSTQKHVSDAFARYAPDQWSGVEVMTGSRGTPLVAEALAHFECEPYAEYEGGDHVIVVGRVTNFGGEGNGSPLLFFQKGYHQLEQPEARGVHA
jgi:flavin reductase (DIM6/NTAB) family NADH-FMN oxidoreductase RutF